MRVLALAASLSLIFASSVALSQSANDQKANPPTGNEDSEQAKTEHINSQDHKTGNDLSANKVDGKSTDDSDPAKTGAINGQNTGSGNNLMGNKKGVHGTVAFDKLDTGHKGVLTKEQGMKDPWLAQHFASCDSDKDGTVSGAEYAICTR